MAFLGLSGSHTDERLQYMQALQQQQYMADALRRAAAYSQPAAPAPAPAPAPVAPTVTPEAPLPPPPDIEGYLSSRFSALPYDAGVQGDIGNRYRQSLSSNPTMSLADAFASAAGGAETDAGTRRLAAINSMYAPGYENTALTSSMYQPTVQSIHDEMLGGAKDVLDRASKRGQLSTAGMNAANTSLTSADPGVMSRLSDIGNSVLSKYRGNVATAITGLEDRARATPWYQPFDPSTNNQGITDAISAGVAGMPGDIRTSVGGSNFFDPSTLLGQAATAQGPINQGKPNVASSGTGTTDEEYKKRAQSNVGVF
jgi:hypothetical protein